MVNVNNRSSGKLAREEIKKRFKKYSGASYQTLQSKTDAVIFLNQIKISFDEVSIDEGDDRFKKEE